MFEKIKDFLSDINLAGAAKAKKSTTEVAKEVLAGKWGNGDKRKTALRKAGYDYDAVQKKVNELVIDKIAREVIAGKWGSGQTRKDKLTKAGYNYTKVQKRVSEILKEQAAKKTVYDKICDWTKQIANGKQYSYKVFTDDPKTHQCPICNNLTGKYKGWNCIGFAYAAWRHGGGIKCNCNCGVVYDGKAEQILKAKTDAEALKLAQKVIGITDIKVIRNGGKSIPASSLKAGDIIMYYEGTSYFHTLVYVGNSKVADCGRGQTPNIKYGNAYCQKYCKVAIRYVGKTESTKTTTTKQGYTGKFPDYKLVKTNAQVIADTIEWAKWIVKDNDFHYGYGPHAHHNGCYFCGTQRLKKGHGIKMWEHTYCCNPFVGAAWAHGGGDATAYKMCHNCNSWDFNKGNGSYEKSSLFDKLGYPKKSKLKAGDVLCNGNHVALYIGDGQIAEASGGDDNVIKSKKWNNSIHITSYSEGRFDRAYRYNGKVNVERPLMEGEVSDRVLDLKKYLIWYGFKLDANKIFSDNTKEAVISFQEKEIGKGQGDGIVGPKTIEAMKKVKK